MRACVQLPEFGSVVFGTRHQLFRVHEFVEEAGFPSRLRTEVFRQGDRALVSCRVEPVAQHGGRDAWHREPDGHLVCRDVEIAAGADHVVGRQHQEYAHREGVAVARGDDGVRISHDACGQGVARAQHPDRSHAAAFHHVEVEARREHRLPAGEDYSRVIRLGAIQRCVDFTQDLRRQRVALAIVDANGGDSALQAVFDGIHCLHARSPFHAAGNAAQIQ